ncbi:MAG: TolC family protein, partial [Alphaproteobacteria bacterium]
MKATRTLRLMPVLGCLAAGCQVGPAFEPPAIELPARYAAAVPAMVGTEDPDSRWWERFDDPLLEELIRRSLRHNLDVAAARSRVREARAVARGVAAGRAPTLDASGGPSAFLRTGDGGTDSAGAIDALLRFGWDADLFGGRQSAQTAAEAEAFRQHALRQETSLAVAAETANADVALRGAQLRAALTEQSLGLQRRTLALVRERAAAGLAAGLDEVRAQAEVSTLSADLPPIRAEIGRNANALAVLAGELPGALEDRLAPARPVPAMDVGPAVGVPAELLRRRPDLRAAELNRMRATAELRDPAQGGQVVGRYPLVVTVDAGAGVLDALMDRQAVTSHA